ncbi:cephalosporin hydroxylase family protein [Akkermansiaceae bacterium]|nr:cephalosporin hydroxylase family protein [Akkermansiaceae bacterium]
MNPIKDFQTEREARIARLGEDQDFFRLSQQWLKESMSRQYVYNFEWLGRPIIQYPQDIVAMQELVWEVKPDLIIETGIAHGGSLILSASLLALLDLAEATKAGVPLDTAKPARKVIGVDIDIRDHNRAEIEAHPFANRIAMVQGSSVAPETVAQVKGMASGAGNIMVCLDSMHTHDHVLAELEAYAPLVSVGSYCVVFDTFVEDMPAGFFSDRPWDPGNNPKTAVMEFVAKYPEFVIDTPIQDKLAVTVAPHGFLKRVR